MSGRASAVQRTCQSPGSWRKEIGGRAGRDEWRGVLFVQRLTVPACQDRLALIWRNGALPSVYRSDRGSGHGGTNRGLPAPRQHQSEGSEVKPGLDGRKERPKAQREALRADPFEVKSKNKGLEGCCYRLINLFEHLLMMTAK
uniref:Uncharacterized protein n=1 Tax=Branchiostoma floridae TaxID=7739 RepID=C3Z1S3_BRAFL|eukprot:XP_002597428.1 hypothetical protein BRAFLDRAFT_80574 [Branchiostoma floridae]